MSVIQRIRERNYVAIREGVHSFIRTRSVQLTAAATLVGLLAYVLRAINLGRSFEIFIDEITYVLISQSVASNLHVQLYHQPFFIHPPALFFMEAAYLKLFSPANDLIKLVYSVRYLNVFFAGLSAALILLIAFRAMGWAAGLLAAWFFALNTFVVRMNSLNMLETIAMSWIIAGYWVILSGMKENWEPWIPLGAIQHWKNNLIRSIRKEPQVRIPTTANQVDEISTIRVILAGIFFGIALLTKETTAFLSLLPMAICFFFRWSIPRRKAAWISLVAVLVYAVYPLTVILSGDWTQFANQKFRGILRFAGILQITGFNRPGAPSITTTLLQRFEQYGTSYLLVALGVIALYFLFSSPRPNIRLIGIWVACSYLMMGYLFFIGTLEDQYFFYLIIPCIIACSVAFAALFKAYSLGFRRQAMINTIVLILMFLSGWDAAQWAKTHFTPDNGYERALAYLRNDVPGGERVASASGTGQYLLGGYLSGPYGLWHSVADLERYRPEYLLMTPDTVIFNYGAEGKALLNWVQQNGNPVFTFSGRENNQIILYKLPFTKGR